MAVYAIGDIQGCLAPLERLLKRLRFDPAQDRLWITGDLVNRGPDSLGVVRLVKSLGDSAVTVLGNHDLHLLAVWAGKSRPTKHDSLDRILAAEDAAELLEWLRRQPLLHHDPTLKTVMTHAGVFPLWTLEQAKSCAAEAEAALRDERFAAFMGELYGDKPDRWSDRLSGWKRLRFIVNALTRMRYCAADGRLLLDFKGSPAQRPDDHYPWFDVPCRKRSEPERVVFGHWSTLGYVNRSGVIALDTGCLWGGQLTAVRLDGQPTRIAIDCPAAMPVGSDRHSY